MNDPGSSLDTRAVHGGLSKPRLLGAAVTPIFQCAVWEHVSDDAGYYAVRYPRMQNLPGHDVVCARLASLENGERALLASSGMAAITTTLLKTLGDGGHLLAQDQLYGATHSFVAHELASFGIGHDFIPTDDPAAWRAKLRPDTRAIYTESLTNPLMRVIDHRAVVAFAREHGIVSIVDNTFMSPINFRPLDLGYDLVVHSCTKYLNGHSDLVAGAVIGRAERVEGIRELLVHLGGSLDPHACFLLDRGMRTLALRVRRQNENASILARHLERHPAIRRVAYPGLTSHPEHLRAGELFDGFGGMLALEFASAEAARRCCDRVTIPIHGPSLGGLETLVVRPAHTSHVGLTPEERAQLGISESLVRMSVGIEGAADLTRDLDAALG